MSIGGIFPFKRLLEYMASVICEQHGDLVWLAATML